jgi:hypothetical protein
MNPATIITQATADGVTLALSATGTIKATGEAVVVNRWLPLIREHKVDIISELLTAANDTAVSPFVEDVMSCVNCQHYARPGKSAGYCSRRDDLPLAYGANHPLRRLPPDPGASCNQWKAEQ